MGGQASSISHKVLPADTVDSLHFEIKKQVHIFSEINNLAYGDFQKCLANLNRLSRKCLDPNGNQLVFAVKKGTDNSILWKRTVRIACVKIDPDTRKIDCFKLLTLQQFLQVFRTFQTNLHAMVTVENARILSPTVSPSKSSNFVAEDGESSSGISVTSVTRVPTSQLSSCVSSAPSHTKFVYPESTTASILMAHIDAITGREAQTDQGDESVSDQNECCICLERKPEVSLPCAHSYCMPCIEQWNIQQKTCPICDEALTSTDETWILSEMPEANEVSEEICATLLKLSKEATESDDSDKNWLRRMLDL